MNPREWTLFIVSRESGKEMPHWTANTRQRCREELRSLKNQCGGKLPKGITSDIRKTFELKNTRHITRAEHESQVLVN